MFYSESSEQAYDYFRMSLSGMMECNVPVNPVNYAVWYEYVSGKNIELSAVMEKLRKQPKALDNEMHKRLYQSYIAEEEKQVTMDALKTIAGVLTALDRGAGEEMKEHEESIADYTSQLMDADKPGEVGEIVDSIISKTKMMKETGRALKEQVNESCRELDELREDISRLKVASLTDPLTGLLNRRGFTEAFRKVVSDKGTSKDITSLIMMDIDCFKRINDTFGHVAGDHVIRKIAATLKIFLRGRGIVGRYGGEEFIACLPATTLPDTEKLCEKIRQAVQSMVWKIKSTGRSMGTITLSMGIGVCRRNEPLESTIQRADRALYLSKENGRNRVTTEQEKGSSKGNSRRLKNSSSPSPGEPRTS